MKHYNSKTNKDEEHRDIDAFMAEIICVCHKHGLWLSHEYDQGAFLITKESTRDWLLAADIGHGYAPPAS